MQKIISVDRGVLEPALLMASVAHGTNDVLEFAMDTSKEIPPDLAVRLFRASLGRGLLSWSKKLEYYVSEDQVSRLGNSDLVPKMIKSGHLDCIFYLLKKNERKWRPHQLSSFCAVTFPCR